MSEWGKLDYANNAPKYLDHNWPGNNNVFLVDAARIANSTFASGHGACHTGWVKVFQGTGFVKAINFANNNSLTYSNTYLTITGNNTTPANAQLVVYGSNTLSVVLNATGAGYNTAPTITASGANNNTLVFTVVPGGRMGRVQAETLVTLSNPKVSDANSGLPYFTGL